MKKLLLFTTLVLLISGFSFSQDREDYSIHWVDGILEPVSNPSSCYWFGHTYTFTISDDEDWFDFVIGWHHMHDGSFVYDYYNVYEYLEHENYTYEVSSCVYDQNLYAFLSAYTGTSTNIQPFIRKVSEDWKKQSAISIPQNITTQFSTVALNDTIYLFFIDDADKYVKYYKLVNNSDNSALELVSTEPVIVNSDYTGISNVAAITYVDDNLKEKIILAYSGEASKSNNKINIYTGIPGSGFELYHRLDCVEGYHATDVSMAQGSVKGGTTGTYNIQFGYTHYNDNGGTVHCELDMKNKEFSAWENLNVSGIFLIGQYSFYMECYNKVSDHHKQKYLIQVATTGANAGRGYMWESDQLIYQDSQDTIPLFNTGKDVIDVVLVAEGAPPYALNGYKLSNNIFSGNSPSNFVFSTSTSQSVSTETTYSLGVEANMGLGPVTLGFKSTFQESSGTSSKETATITQNIEPSTYDSDSAGNMWYFYVTPTIERHRWELFDWEGNTIDSSKRNLFFFELKEPSMLIEKQSLNNYGDNSPREYDLESYVGREVINIDGVESLYNKAVSLDFGGTFPDLSIELEEESTKSNSAEYEVSVGVEFDVPIIDASGDASASFSYSRESTTTFTKSQTIEASWLSFRPPSTNPDSESNVRAFNPEMYFMKTTDSTAYFLPEGFEKFRPFFITYEVSGIVHGNLNDPPYYINERDEIADKYSISLFPSPAYNELNINYLLNQSSNVKIDIYNNYGSLVHSEETRSYAGKNETHINVTSLDAGLYIVKISIDTDIYSCKIIVN